MWTTGFAPLLSYQLDQTLASSSLSASAVLSADDHDTMEILALLLDARRCMRGIYVWCIQSMSSTESK